MYRRIILPLLLALTIAVAAACAAAVETEPGEASVPEPGAQVAAESPLPTVVITTGESLTAVQGLDWDADEENCVLPGAVITGAGAGLPPCEPTPAAEPEPNAAEPTPTVQQETSPMPTEPAPEEPAPTEPAAEDAPQPQAQSDEAARVAALAVDDLAQQLGIPAGDIEVREVRAVTWPDASMGCPEPDMMYAQMLQEGYLIRLSAQGEVYHYHSGGDQAPFLCEQDPLQLQEPDPRATDEFVPPPGFDLDKRD